MKLKSYSITNNVLIKEANKFYEKGYSGLDLMNYIEHKDTNVDTAENLLEKYKLLMLFHKVKSDFRSEQLFMTFILTFLFSPNDNNNICI